MAARPPSWREPEALLELATLGVAERVGNARAEISAALEGLDAAGRMRFFSMPRIDLSSTDIRARVRAGRSVRYLVPDDVARLIDVRGLYRTEVPVT
jgi:nicotinate-nucleotide adenylyltransferase